MASQLTTHALDTVKGFGAAGLRVALERLTPSGVKFAPVTLDDRGRCILAEGDDFCPGDYEMIFEVAEYHRLNNVEMEDPPFLRKIIVRFTTGENHGDYHVPILFSPYGYTIYRGS